jgi:hypothetical protein
MRSSGRGSPAARSRTIRGACNCLPRAYNLANFLRRLALPQDVKHWSLTTLREKLVKIGAKVTLHAKYVTFQMSEVAVTRRLFAAILDRIARLATPPPQVT